MIRIVRVSRIAAFAFACLLVVAGCAPAAAPALPTAAPTSAPAAAAPDIAAPAKAWVAALNAGDADAALALFTDDAKLDLFVYHARSKVQMRKAFETLIELEVRQQIASCQPQKDNVLCTDMFADACITAFGATDGLPLKVIFTFEDGKIRQALGTTDGDKWTGFNEYHEDVRQWGLANLDSDGSKDLSPELCRAYATAMK